ncbi:Arm DNA-binding domain-containing protein [Teichococcus aestuarii]|uniref:Arm DNA-binding domain-containing protein n=1 Tax=Teichococcus aestuarii TaxID=568898 RepID=UPI0036133339
MEHGPSCLCSVCSEGLVKLGKREIDAITCPPDRQDLLVFDDQLPGFALRVTKAGKKVFLFQYRFGGRVQRMVLGDYGVLTPRRRVGRRRKPVAGSGRAVTPWASARPPRPPP